MTPAVPSMLSRRRFLGGTGALGLAAALGACTNEKLSPVRAPTSGAGGLQELDVLTWPDYIDPDAIEAFKKATFDTVNYNTDWDNVGSFTDVLEPTVGKGKPSRYDIVVPTFWAAERMVRRGWADPLPLELIPNRVNLDPAYMAASWDRGARFHMPWQAGITGIAYNPALTKRRITSLADLFDPAFKGKVGFVDQMREAVPLRMLLNGGDPTRPTEAAATKALADLKAAKASGQIAKFVGSGYLDSLQSGEFALCLAWSGDIVQLQRSRPDIEFVIPTEGGMRWFDTMVIPKGAAHVAAAGAWMNFFYDPQNAASITEFVQFISPVLGVQDELIKRGGDAAKLATSPILFPDDATKRRLYFWGGLAVDVEDRLDTDFATLL